MDICFTFPDGQREAQEVNGLVPGEMVKGGARVRSQVFGLHDHSSFCNILLGSSAPDGIRREGAAQEASAPCSLQPLTSKLIAPSFLWWLERREGARVPLTVLGQVFGDRGHVGPRARSHLLQTRTETSFQRQRPFMLTLTTEKGREKETHLQK